MSGPHGNERWACCGSETEEHRDGCPRVMDLGRVAAVGCDHPENEVTNFELGTGRMFAWCQVCGATRHWRHDTRVRAVWIPPRHAAAQRSEPTKRHGWTLRHGRTVAECPGCSFAIDADQVSAGPDREFYDCHNCGDSVSVPRGKTSKVLGYPNIERCCQLHEEVELLYVVDGYEAMLRTADGDRIVAQGHGSDVVAALGSLERCLEGKALKDVRAADAATTARRKAALGGWRLFSRYGGAR